MFCFVRVKISNFNSSTQCKSFFIFSLTKVSFQVKADGQLINLSLTVKKDGFMSHMDFF